jgi:hypothetical protein
MSFFDIGGIEMARRPWSKNQSPQRRKEEMDMLAKKRIDEAREIITRGIQKAFDKATPLLSKAIGCRISAMEAEAIMNSNRIDERNREILGVAKSLKNQRIDIRAFRRLNESDRIEIFSQLAKLLQDKGLIPRGEVSDEVDLDDDSLEEDMNEQDNRQPSPPGPNSLAQLKPVDLASLAGGSGDESRDSNRSDLARDESKDLAGIGSSGDGLVGNENGGDVESEEDLRKREADVARELRLKRMRENIGAGD